MLAELALIMGEAFGKLFDQEFATCTWVFDPNLMIPKWKFCSLNFAITGAR